MEEGIKVLGENTEIKPVVDNSAEIKPVNDGGIKPVMVNESVSMPTNGTADEYIEGIPDWSIEPEVQIKR